MKKVIQLLCIASFSHHVPQSSFSSDPSFPVAVNIITKKDATN